MGFVGSENYWKVRLHLSPPSHLLLALTGRCPDPHRKSLLNLANPLTINYQSFSLRSTTWSTFESCPISDRSNPTSTNLEETPPMSKRSRLLRERNLWSRITMRWSMLRNTCLWVKRCLGQKLYRMFSLSLSLFPLPHDSQTLKVLESSLRNEKLIPSPIHRAITPGTSNLVPLLVKQGLTDQSKPVNKLSLQEWTKIADTFEDWPFRPAVRRYPFSTRLLLSELTNGKVDSIYRT